MPAKLAFNNRLFSEYNEISCYWGGFIAADGNVSKCGRKFTIALERKDHGHLLSLKSDLGSEHKLTPVTNANGSLMYFLSIRDLELCNDLLNNFNIVPNKSLVYNPPRLEERLMRHFVRGMFDGDGCISKSKASGITYPQASFVSGSIICIETINKFLNENCPVNSKIGKSGNIYRIQWTGSSAEDVLDYLYDNCSRFLSRKMMKYAEL